MTAQDDASGNETSRAKSSRAESSRGGSWSGEGAPRERRLAALLTRLDTQRRALEGTLRLGTADLRLLWLFADGRSRTLKEIAHELGLEQSTVNRQVNGALGSGLLERTRRPGGTAYEFGRTAEGGLIFEDEVGVTLGVYADALASMGDRDAEVFLELTGRFLGHFTEAVDTLGR